MKIKICFSVENLELPECWVEAFGQTNLCVGLGDYLQRRLSEMYESDDPDLPEPFEVETTWVKSGKAPRPRVYGARPEWVDRKIEEEIARDFDSYFHDWAILMGVGWECRRLEVSARFIVRHSIVYFLDGGLTVWAPELIYALNGLADRQGDRFWEKVGGLAGGATAEVARGQWRDLVSDLGINDAKPDGKN